MMRSKVELARVVAHKIRSPILAIEMMLPCLGEIPDKVRRVMNVSVAEIKSLSEKLKKSSIGQQEDASRFGIEEFSLKALLLDRLDQKGFEMSDQKNMSLSFDAVDASDSRIKANKCVLRGVFSNLINNAMEAYGECLGHVTLQLRNERRRIEVVISDNGTGIPEAQLEKIGELSFSTKAGVGRGIGVIHARSAIETYGGSIRYESKSGIGTRVIVTLPSACVALEAKRNLRNAHVGASSSTTH